MKMAILLLILIWSTFGAILYLVNIDDISNIWKKRLTVIISGPIIWTVIIFWRILCYLSLVDIAYVGLVRWLKKP